MIDNVTIMNNVTINIYLYILPVKHCKESSPSSNINIYIYITNIYLILHILDNII